LPAFDFPTNVLGIEPEDHADPYEGTHSTVQRVHPEPRLALVRLTIQLAYQRAQRRAGVLYGLVKDCQPKLAVLAEGR
jgi:hypothetical protein